MEEPGLVCCFLPFQMLAALPSLPSLRPLSILVARIPSTEKSPQKRLFIRLRCSLCASSLAVFICCGRRPSPRVPARSISVSAGHEEYPALTWHIRSDDRDQTGCTFREGNITKKEGKRETEGEERKREEEGGDTRDHIWAVVTPWELQHSRVCRVFTVALNSPILTCGHSPPLTGAFRRGLPPANLSQIHFCVASPSSSSARRLFNVSLLPRFAVCC